jgi:signal transduction histidine kinase
MYARHKWEWAMPYSQRSRTARRIAVARLILATFSLFAVWLDPGAAGHHSDALYPLVAGYAVYAGLVALLLGRASLRLNRLQIVAHAIDIAVFSTFIYLTAGTTSLFFVYFVFALITGTLRWQWRGTVATAALTLVAFLGFGILSEQGQHDPDYELGRLIIGIVYLAVVAWLLAFLGMHEARMRQEVGKLAAWSQDFDTDDDLGGPHTRWLAQAADTMGVRRAMFAWEDEAEPWLQIALWEDGHTTISRAAPDEFSPLVAADLAGAAFVCADARGGPATRTLHGTEEDLHVRRGPPVHEAFADRFAMGTVISAPVNAEEGEARLFFLDKRRTSSDDLALVNIVARGVTVLTVDSHLRARLRESAAFEERVRLARDLHDGVVQSLAGTALQLETARRHLAGDSPAAREIIESVQDSLTQEQRDLRHFVDGLRPGLAVESPVTPDLRGRLREVRESVSRQWELTVEVLLENDLEDCLDATSITEDDLTLDIAFIVHEGLVNSARHARATRAWAIVRCTSARVDVVLGDDGHGLAFQGRLDMAALRDLGTGPRTLMQRTESRGGTLTVDSSAEGSRIEITLPLAAGRAGLREVV